MRIPCCQGQSCKLAAISRLLSPGPVKHSARKLEMSKVSSCSSTHAKDIESVATVSSTCLQYWQIAHQAHLQPTTCYDAYLLQPAYGPGTFMSRMAVLVQAVGLTPLRFSEAATQNGMWPCSYEGTTQHHQNRSRNWSMLMFLQAWQSQLG